jgi:hypothetical protein
MDARITRLEEHVADLRGDVANLQAAERARERKSFVTMDVALHAMQMIAVMLAGVLLGVALAINSDRCNRADGNAKACVERGRDQAKSPAAVEADDAQILYRATLRQFGGCSMGRPGRSDLVRFRWGNLDSPATSRVSLMYLRVQHRGS